MCVNTAAMAFPMGRCYVNDCNASPYQAVPVISTPGRLCLTFRNKQYAEGINDRYAGCDFPYLDCFRRCALRKLVAYVPGQTRSIGVLMKDGQGVARARASGWEGYDFF